MNSTSPADALTPDRSMPDLPCEANQRMQLRAEYPSSQSDTPPEHRLMIALVRDAVRSIEKYRHARDFRGKRLFAQDSDWVLSNDTGWIYAFLRVCETLNLDPDSVRIALGLLPAGPVRRVAATGAAATLH